MHHPSSLRAENQPHAFALTGPYPVVNGARAQVRAYGVLAGLLLLGQLPAAAAWKWADLPYFIGLAVTTIYIGRPPGRGPGGPAQG